MPNLLDSVVSAFDFAQTASVLYAEGNPDVRQAANMLFGSGYEDRAIGRYPFVTISVFESELTKIANSAKLTSIAWLGAGYYKGVATDIKEQVGPGEVVSYI